MFMEKKANLDLRLACKGAGVPLWRVAEVLGVSDQTLYRNWRKELSVSDKKRVLDIIEQEREV